MKFKIKETAIDPLSKTPVSDYLRTLGISKVDSFIKSPLEEDEESYKLLTNLTPALEMLHKHLEADSSIFLQVDSDADGYTSAAIIYNFIITINPDADIHFNIHPEKEHGIFPDDVGYEHELVIIPDAGSNQAEETQDLSRRADVLILDHHLADVDINTDKVIVVNNQTSVLFSNKSLSGAGVTYKFVQAYCEKYGYGELYKKYQDLAAVGIIADAMDSRNLDNNYIIYHGLRNIHNPMLKALIDFRSYSISSVEKPNKIDIAWYIAPIINGLIRFGDMQQKRDFFYGLANDTLTDTYERISRGEFKQETYYEKTAREAANVKTQQDNAVKKLIPILENRIESNGLDKNKIIVCKTSKSDPDEVPKTVTGLVAMKLAVKYNRPVLVVRPVFKGGEISHYAGSGRAIPADGFNSFKDFLDESGMTQYAAGHNMAFGAGLKEHSIPKLIEYANQELADIDFGSSTLEVDGYFQYSMPKDLLIEFAEVIDIFGNGIPQPQFVFDFIIGPNDFSALGKNKAFLKINYSGISFVDMWAGETIDRLEKEVTSPRKIRVAGRPELNVFNGRSSLQIRIDELDILDDEVSLF